MRVLVIDYFRNLLTRGWSDPAKEMISEMPTLGDVPVASPEFGGYSFEFLGQPQQSREKAEFPVDELSQMLGAFGGQSDATDFLAESAARARLEAALLAVEAAIHTCEAATEAAASTPMSLDTFDLEAKIDATTSEVNLRYSELKSLLTADPSRTSQVVADYQSRVDAVNNWMPQSQATPSWNQSFFSTPTLD